MALLPLKGLINTHLVLLSGDHFHVRDSPSVCGFTYVVPPMGAGAPEEELRAAAGGRSRGPEVPPRSPATTLPESSWAPRGSRCEALKESYSVITM